MKKILKYISVFIITLISLAFLQNIIISIPNKYIEKNMNESVEYYKNKKNHTYFIYDKSENEFLRYAVAIDTYTDCLTLNMIWNSNKNPNSLEAQTLMEFYDDQFSVQSKNLYETVINNTEANYNYTRYWHGSIIYIKTLLLLFNIKEIKIINIILLFSLTIYLLFLIFKKSKKLCFSFIIGLLTISYIIIPLCFEYYFIFLIMIILSIISMKTLEKKDNYFFSLMTISGVASCFFDFLTCETLALTIPLFLRIYFQKEKKTQKENLIFVIKSCICWGLAYAFTFVAKWILSAIVLGPTHLFEIWKKAEIRLYKINMTSPIENVIVLQNVLSLFFPFNLFNRLAALITILFFLFVIWVYIFSVNKKKKSKLKILFIIAIIPIIRLVGLYAHTVGHYFFDYRAILPLIIFSIIVLIEGIQYEIKNYKNRNKRERKEKN